FFFQAEDGIRGFHVTGVQTCALPISAIAEANPDYRRLAERDRRIASVVETLRALLKERLRASEKSQLNLAQELGVDPSAVSRGLSGKGDIGLKTLLRYADALDANPAELLGLALQRAGGGWPEATDAVCQAALLRQTIMTEIRVEKRQHMMHPLAGLLGLGSGTPDKMHY